MRFDSRLTPFILGCLYIAITPILSVGSDILGLGLKTYLIIIILGLLLAFIRLNLIRKTYFTHKPVIETLIVLFMITVGVSIVQNPEFLAPTEKYLNTLYVIVLPLITIYLSTIGNRCSNPLPSKYINNIVLNIFSFSVLTFAILYILFKESGESLGRYILPGLPNSIWVARVFGSGLIICLGSIITGKSSVSSFSIFNSIIFFVCLLNVGARGPLLATILILAFAAYKYLDRARNIFFVFLILFLTILFTTLTMGLPYLTNLYSIYARFDQLNFVISTPLSFLGHGFSSFGRYYYNLDVDAYPHNLFAEIYFDFGLLGLCLLCALVFSIFRGKAVSLLFLLTLYCLINTLFSGDLPAANRFFISAYLLFLEDRFTNSSYPISSDSD